MSKNRIVIVIGILIALMPALGFPHSWESFFQVVVGLGLVFISVWATIDKRLTLKAKAEKRQLHKRRMTEMESQAETDRLHTQEEEL